MKITHAFRFEAAHRLPHVPPTHRCRNMHGHTYRAEVTLSGKVRDDGMVADFYELEMAMAPVLAQLDHATLNEVMENPTAENIATWIAERLALPQLASVRVYENPDCWAEWERER